MITFRVDEKRSDLLVAVQKLAKLAGDGKIKMHQVTEVSTGDPDLIDILGALLVVPEIEAINELERKLWMEPELPSGLLEMQQRVDAQLGVRPKNGGGKTVQVKGPRKINHRSCAICGEEFTVKRGGGKVCGKPECRRALAKKQQQKYLSKKKIQAVVPAMEVPADAPGPLASGGRAGLE